MVESEENVHFQYHLEGDQNNECTYIVFRIFSFRISLSILHYVRMSEEILKGVRYVVLVKVLAVQGLIMDVLLKPQYVQSGDIANVPPICLEDPNVDRDLTKISSLKSLSIINRSAVLVKVLAV